MSAPAANRPRRARDGLGAALALAMGLAWGALALGAGSLAPPMLCSALAWSAPSPGAYAFALGFLSPWRLAGGWGVMLVAMMPPVLYAPLRHLRETGFRRAWPGRLSLFLLGYLGVWMLAGAALHALALTLTLASPGPGRALVPALLAALIWQVSPWRQAALNRCHRRPSLAAFPPAAWRDAVRFGALHGLWCAASCWAAMLAALAAPAHPLAAMALAALWIWAERAEPARPPAWRLHPPLRALRAAAWRLARHGPGRGTMPGIQSSRQR